MVTHTLDSFVDSELRICGEIAIDVEQCLLAQPGVTEGTIERVYSHPQGLAQCRGWLAANPPRAPGGSGCCVAGCRTWRSTSPASWWSVAPRRIRRRSTAATTRPPSFWRCPT